MQIIIYKFRTFISTIASEKRFYNRPRPFRKTKSCAREDLGTSNRALLVSLSFFTLFILGAAICVWLIST